VINVDVQRATLYHDDDVVGWTYLASGIPSFPTPTGEFKILEKVKDKVSNLYGKGYDANGKLVNSDFKQGRDLLPPGGRFQAAKMTYFMRLTGDGVGMHIGPIPRPGRRASHGCIRLPSKMAPDSLHSCVHRHTGDDHRQRAGLPVLPQAVQRESPGECREAGFRQEKGRGSSGPGYGGDHAGPGRSQRSEGRCCGSDRNDDACSSDASPCPPFFVVALADGDIVAMLSKTASSQSSIGSRLAGIGGPFVMPKKGSGCGGRHLCR
jgi:hypothetical protein